MTVFLGVGLIDTLVGYGVYAILISLRVPFLITLLTAPIERVIFKYISINRLVLNSTVGLITIVKVITVYSVVYFINAIGLELSIHYLRLDLNSGCALCLQLTLY